MITTRFVYPEEGRGPTRPARSRSDLHEWLQQIKRAERDHLIGHFMAQVARALALHQGPGGIYPSLATLALTAACSRRHVVRALDRLEYLGLVKREARRRTARGRVWQDSNRYALLLPARLPELRPWRRPLPLSAALLNAVFSAEQEIVNLVPVSGDQRSLPPSRPPARRPAGLSPAQLLAHRAHQLRR